MHIQSRTDLHINSDGVGAYEAHSHTTNLNDGVIGKCQRSKVTLRTKVKLLQLLTKVIVTYNVNSVNIVESRCINVARIL